MWRPQRISARFVVKVMFYNLFFSVHSASFCLEHSPLFKKLSTRPHIWREACRGGTHYYLVKWRVSPSILIWAVRPKFSVIIKSGIICSEKAAYLTAADQTPFFDWLLFDKSLGPSRGFRVKRRTDWFNAQMCFSSEAQKAIHSHLLYDSQFAVCAQNEWVYYLL